jgi:hypothetical protein
MMALFAMHCLEFTSLGRLEMGALLAQHVRFFHPLSIDHNSLVHASEVFPPNFLFLYL